VVSVTGEVATLVENGGARFSVPLKGTPPAEGESFYFAVRRDKVEVEKEVEGTAEHPEETNAVQGTVILTEYQGTWVKVTVKREGAENFVASIPDDRFFANTVTEGDRIIARWPTEAIHPLAHEGGEDMSRLYGEDFNSTPAYLEGG
jgi:hypothetical protein